MTRVSIDTDELRRELERVVGPRRVSTDANDLATYARDMWPRLLLAVREGDPPAYPPHLVVWPESSREVAAIVRLARTMKVPVVPYGGGSGVCGGAVPVRGGITLDLKRMDEITAVNGEEMICDVQAGVNGERFERELEHRGFTFGNFPSSIYCSTVGGWLATRAAGQMSTKYGKVEDRVAGLTVVTGRGEVVKTDGLQRATRGPSFTQLLLGSEGTLGIITSARLHLAPSPALRLLRGFRFENVAAGVEAIRRVLQRGLRPAVVRLYDGFDTFLHSLGGGDEHRADAEPAAGSGILPPIAPPDAGDGSLLARGLALLGRRGGPAPRNLEQLVRRELTSAALARPRLLNGLAGALVDRVARKGCLLIVGCEGPRIRTEVEGRLVFDELERAGGTDLGEEEGRHWLEHRYSISYKMSGVFREGMFVDTMEVASTWDRLLDLYQQVRGALSQHAVVLAHFSHAYPEGCSIYFTFAGRGADRRASEKLYDAIWRDGLTAASRVGGTISHHHGVGMLKAAHMNAEHREAMAVLRALKQTLDPDGIMNPGKLGLDGGAA
ncbi:MAG TPA: FAD-binding oxidoreductase [Kofleriaceae bacterium]|nr:FAD-binding oxidoreductase [Kofleriaceae bacterium]